jgi:hypothetical protein
MAAETKTLTLEEFAILLAVGNTVSDPAPMILTEHSARLIAPGYRVDLGGRLRMTTPRKI